MCHPLVTENRTYLDKQSGKETAAYVTNRTADKRRDYYMQEEIKKTM
jgi:hypothetical protein